MQLMIITYTTLLRIEREKDRFKKESKKQMEIERKKLQKEIETNSNAERKMN